MNNRKIKFRIWTKMDLDESKNNDIMLTPGDNILKEIYFDGTPWDEKTEGILMQFTGIKDSKGKEIYEGDIVNVNGNVHIIEWRGAGFAATWSDYNLDSCWFVGGAPVVIGNIFENPELAEKARKSPRL